MLMQAEALWSLDHDTTPFSGSDSVNISTGKFRTFWSLGQKRGLYRLNGGYYQTLTDRPLEMPQAVDYQDGVFDVDYKWDNYVLTVDMNVTIPNGIWDTLQQWGNPPTRVMISLDVGYVDKEWTFMKFVSLLFDVSSFLQSGFHISTYPEAPYRVFITGVTKAVKLTNAFVKITYKYDYTRTLNFPSTVSPSIVGNLTMVAENYEGKYIINDSAESDDGADFVHV